MIDEELKVLDDHLFAGGVPADDGVGGGVVDDGEELDDEFLGFAVNVLCFCHLYQFIGL